MNTILLLYLPFFLLPISGQDVERMRIQRSAISFVSDAPLEHITASNSRSTGILDLKERTFAIQIPISEFEGFNSPLQREHFNENYMSSRKWPNATFSGRIIENVDLTAPGEYTVRAKGDLTLRGIKRERIIPCKIIVSDDGIRVTSNFDVLLDQHDIRVPRVVQQKIAAVIQVEIDTLFSSQDRAQ